MILIAGTDPIHYLILIGEIELLPALFQRVLVPISVCEELKRPLAPDVVRTWIAKLPEWLEVRAPRRSPGADLACLGAGDGMPFCWPRNWGPIRSSLMKFPAGGSQSGDAFPARARWAYWQRSPTTDWWICGTPWIVRAGRISALGRNSWSIHRGPVLKL